MRDKESVRYMKTIRLERVSGSVRESVGVIKARESERERERERERVKQTSDCQIAGGKNRKVF